MLPSLPDLLRWSSYAFRLLAHAAFWLLVLPWVVREALCAVALRLRSYLFSALGAWRSVRGEVYCPRGHRAQLLGAFGCRSCGAAFPGFAFQECPVCRTSCGHIPCDRCGLSVVNPLLPPP